MNHMKYNELEPKAVFGYFKDLSDIPRESGNEEGVQQYLLNFAKEHNFTVNVDKAGNVIMKVPATKGYEAYPSVAIQGHMDMVCVKDAGVKHDFAHDPIHILVEGDFITADGTTLGGDDGIAIAMALAVFTDENCKHGPLEGIFTKSEETGMDGAFGLDASLVESRKLINLDSEEEGIIYIGCAGGIETESNLAITKSATGTGYKGFTLRVQGLMGGHSGGEIDKQRANAIKLAARTLNSLKTIRLENAQGGTKRNVIPSTAEFSFVLKKEEVAALEQAVKDINEAYANEYATQDPQGTITVEAKECPSLTFSREDSTRLIRALHMAPHGVEAMSTSLPGVVETSSNMAIIQTTEEGISVISSHRSSIMSSRDDIALRFKEIMETSGATVALKGPYPSWQPDTSSPLLAFCSKAYEDFSHKKPEITAIHAGLECGIINSRVKGMDSVSFGPGMSGVHSTEEKLCISSVERTTRFLKHLLSIIR